MQWLPAEITRLGTAAGMPEVTVRFQISGEGGGTWDLGARGGELDAAVATDEVHPQVTIAMTTADLRAIIIGEEGPVDLAPPEASPTDLLFVDRTARTMLDTVSGTFLFEVHGYNGRTWRLSATFGGGPAGDEPDAVIAIDAELYGQILAREKSAAEAYFTGGIKLTGDMEKGMQVGVALMPKF